MRILVTGSEGTLGRPLVAELERRGHGVVRCDLAHENVPVYDRVDVAEYRELAYRVKWMKPELLVHLAAEFGRNNGEHYYERMWRTNVIGTRNILELQREFRFDLIFASSSEVYGEMDGELTEDRVGTRLFNDYAMSKWVNEQQCLNFAERYGSRIMRLRFCNTCGPGERYHWFRSVIALFVYRALHDLPFTVYEECGRCFLDIRDFTVTLANACERFVAGECVNIGGTEYRTMREVAERVLALTGSRSRVEWVPKEKHNVSSKRPSLEKARLLLGHDPQISFEQMLADTAAWMRSEYAASIVRREVSV